MTLDNTEEEPPTPGEVGARSADSPLAGEGDKLWRRVVRRYSNRKPYDMKDSRYVTLHELGQIVRGRSLADAPWAAHVDDLDDLPGLAVDDMDSERLDASEPF